MVITNRTPAALEGVRPGALLYLMADIAALARRAGPDLLDWVYQSWAYDTHDVF